MQSRLSQRPPQKTGTPSEIPDKLYFRIGDVARLCGVEAYVLRFWESEFPQLHPNKSGTGQRLYRKRDVELALRIKRLLYEDGYTIAGARQVFQAENRRGGSAQAALPGMAAKQVEAGIEKVKTGLRELLGMLSVLPLPAAGGSTHPVQTLGGSGHRPQRVAPRRLARLETLQPEAIEPEAVKPEAIRPEAIRPEAIRPQAIRLAASAAVPPGPTLFDE